MPSVSRHLARFRNPDLESSAERFIFVGTALADPLQMYRWSSGGGFGEKVAAPIGAFGAISDLQFDSETDRLFISGGARTANTGARPIGMARVTANGISGFTSVDSASSPGTSTQIRLDGRNRLLFGSCNNASIGGRVISVGESSLTYELTSFPSPAAAWGLSVDPDSHRVAIGISSSSTDRVEVRAYHPPSVVSTKIPGADLTAEMGTSCSALEFSRNGNRLLCGVNQATYGVAVLNTTGGSGVVSKMAPTVSSPFAVDLKLNPAGTAVAIATQSTAPRFGIIKFDGSNLVGFIPAPSVLPAGECWKVAWSPSGEEVAVCSTASPYVIAYRLIGADIAVKYADPMVGVGGAAHAVCFAR